MLKKHKNEMIITLGIIYLLSLFTSGYQFLYADSTAFIPIIKYYSDSSLYSKDEFIHSMSKLPLPFLMLLSVLSQIINLKWLFFILFLLVRLLFVIGIFNLAMLLFKNRFVGYLATIFVLDFGGITLGGSAPTDYVLTPRIITFALLIFSIYFFLKMKYFFSFLLLGLASNIHLKIAAALTLMYCFYFIIQRKKITKAVLYSLTPYGLLLIPVLPSLFGDKITATTPDFLTLLRLTIPFEVFPFSLPLRAYLLFFLLVFMGSVAYLSYKSRYNKDILILSAGILLLSLINILFAEVYPNQLIMRITLIKNSTVFLSIFALIYVANYMVSSIRKKTLMKIPAMLGIIFVAFHFIYPLIAANPPNFEIPGMEVTSSWTDVNAWVRENTEKDSLFLAPYDSSGFKALSERSSFLNKHTISQGEDDVAFASVALERLYDLCGSRDIDKANKANCNYDNLKQKDFERIVNKYNIDYIITSKAVNLDFGKIYDNDDYIVYKVE
jgi:hypothetical protein